MIKRIKNIRQNTKIFSLSGVKKYKINRIMLAINLICIIIPATFALFEALFDYYGIPLGLVKEFNSGLTDKGLIWFVVYAFFVIIAIIGSFFYSNRERKPLYYLIYNKVEISDFCYRIIMQKSLENKEKLQKDKIKLIDYELGKTTGVYSLPDNPTSFLENELKELLHELFAAVKGAKGEEFEFKVTLGFQFRSKRFPDYIKWHFDGEEANYPAELYFTQRGITSKESGFYRFLEGKVECICDDKKTLFYSNPQHYSTAAKNGQDLNGSIAYIKEWVGIDNYESGILLAIIIHSEKQSFSEVNRLSSFGCRGFDKILLSLIERAFLPMNKVMIYNIYLKYLHEKNPNKGDE
jgi:hypothetical protein